MQLQHAEARQSEGSVVYRRCTATFARTSNDGLCRIKPNVRGKIKKLEHENMALKAIMVDLSDSFKLQDEADDANRLMSYQSQLTEWKSKYTALENTIERLWNKERKSWKAEYGRGEAL
jgi:hypothetical protein